MGWIRKTIILLVALLVLVGCFDSQRVQEEQLARYETYWTSMLNETQFQTTSRNFNIEVDIDKVDNFYEYYVVIDEPKVAMYDIEIMVIENSELFDAFDRMLPSVGIFDEPFNMVPYQVRRDLNYREGAALVRQELTEPQVTIQVMVMWKNYTRLESFREMFEFELDYDAKQAEIEDSVSDEDDNEQNNESETEE